MSDPHNTVERHILGVAVRPFQRAMGHRGSRPLRRMSTPAGRPFLNTQNEVGFIMVRVKRTIQFAGATSLCSTSDLKGASVCDRKGRRIGTLRDVVLFARNGTVSYAVIGFGGILGLGEQRVAIPWTRLRVAPSGRSVQLDEGKRVLALAPSATTRTVLNFGNPDVHATMYRQYASLDGACSESRHIQQLNDRYRSA